MTRYELLDRIGVGGMAEIFRGKAIAAGGFEKPVAIKRILPHLSQDKRFVELLIAEAKVLSLLKHRNIVQIFDVGLGDDEQYFLVMEYVDGKDVGAIQRGLEHRRSRIPFDLVLHLGSEICEALEHAHSARAPDGKPMSLVHRDVSPSNVLLSRAGEVKLTDFGIAKRAEHEPTSHGAVRGKFAYISPEQARNEHLEPRSDVFSVGILLWELVTNRRLFSGLGDLEALRSVREAPIPRPREADPRLSPEIDQLIAQALSRDPKQRPTAGQLGQQLRSLRYSLDATSGDPATELAKILDGHDEDTDRRKSRPVLETPLPPLHADVEMSEATVIRIHTADAFAMDAHDSAGVARARQVIDRFEEEETRLAQLSRDEIELLHAQARDSGELTSAAIEPPRPAAKRPRARQPTDEQTRTRLPIDVAVGEIDDPSDGVGTALGEQTNLLGPDSISDVLGNAAPLHLPDTLEPSAPFEVDEATRLLAPTRRTPPPQRVVRPQIDRPPPERPQLIDTPPIEPPRKRRPSTQPPPKPRLMTQPPPMPAEHTSDAMRYTPPPGTVQQRLPSTPSPSQGSAGNHPQPPAPAPRAAPQPPAPRPAPAPVPRPAPQQVPPMAAPRPMPPHPAQASPMMMGPRAAPAPMAPMAPMPMAPMPMASMPMAPMPATPVPGQPNPMSGPMSGPMMGAPPQAGGMPMPGYGNWGAPGPRSPDGYPQRPSIAAMQRPPRRAIKPWMLVIGALIMALLAFAVTRAFIHPGPDKPAPATGPSK